MWPVTESSCGSEHRSATLITAPFLRGTVLLIVSLAACTSRPPPTVQESESAVPEIVSAPAADNPPLTTDESIAALQVADPGSTEALNDHLEYADRLVSADGADCQERLDAAQSELALASADPSFEVVLPLGKARRADLRYRIHVALASCKAAPPQRESELREALASAQEAVALYRDALDYVSMTVAQFNVAVTQRLLKDNDASVASLEAAIALDKEFGLHQDAAENVRLLARWRGNSDTADAEFPTRTVTLKSWRPHDAQVNVRVDEASVIYGNIVRAQAHRTFNQHVERKSGDWVLSYAPGEIGYDQASWPEGISDVRELAMSFERGLGIPAVMVRSRGNFERVLELDTYSRDQIAAARALVLDHSNPERVFQFSQEYEWRMLGNAFHPATIRTEAAEDYNLQVGMWLGATLEQGVWYKLAVPLTLPAARQILLPTDVEFAYTRDVPCTGAASQRSCIEIVVHAVAQADAVKDLLAQFDYPFVKGVNRRMHYWAATYIRIVTDPETLATRVYDVRNYWHLSDKKAVDEGMENRSERIVTTFAYP